MGAFFNHKGEYECRFYKGCGIPTKKCIEDTCFIGTEVQHIYREKKIGEQMQVKYLCTKEGAWTDVEHVCPMKNHVSKGYHVMGAKQWSLGAGHNSNCPWCLLEFAKRKMKTDNILMGKLIVLLEESLNK